MKIVVSDPLDMSPVGRRSFPDVCMLMHGVTGYPALLERAGSAELGHT